MRRFIVVVFLMLLAVAGAKADEPEHRVLFIGNSITYVNDLPSAFASLAPEGMHLEVDMIASGGASLADAMHNPLVVRPFQGWIYGRDPAGARRRCFLSGIVPAKGSLRASGNAIR